MQTTDPAISPASPPPVRSSGEPENPTELLAVRLAQGEAEAFWELFEHFGERLVGSFTRRGVPDTDAESLALECLQNVRRRISQYERRENGSFAGWIFTMANRMRIDWWRRNGTAYPLEDDMLSTLSTEALPIALEEEAPEEIRRAIHEALEQLSDSDRELIRLRYLDAHLDNAALAARLGIQVNAAKTRLSRALRRLQPILEQDPRINIRR